MGSDWIRGHGCEKLSRRGVAAVSVSGGNAEKDELGGIRGRTQSCQAESRRSLVGFRNEARQVIDRRMDSEIHALSEINVFSE